MARSAAARARAQPPLDTLAPSVALHERQSVADPVAPALFEPAILHVRVPHFAAVVAAQVQPGAPGRALIVIGAGRVGVLAASPAALATGVTVGMAARAAETLCPAALIVPLDPDLLAPAAERVLETLGRYTPLVEPGWLGVGRRARPDWTRLARCLGVTLDVRGCERLFGTGRVIAARIGADLAALDMVAHVGVASNANLAAVVSAVAAQPAPHTDTTPISRKTTTSGDSCSTPLVVPVGGEQAFLDDLPLDLFETLDDEVIERLRLVGVRKAGQLARLSETALRRRFGAAGTRAHAEARGAAQRPVIAPQAPPVLTASRDLDDATADGRILEGALRRLARKLARDLAARGQAASLITLEIRSPRRSRDTIDPATDRSRRTLPSDHTPRWGVRRPVPAVGGRLVSTRSLHLKAPVATEAALLARARELLAQLAPNAPVAALRLELAALSEAAIQLSFPLPLAHDGAPRSDLEMVAHRLRDRFGPRAACRVRLAPAALLPEERVIWDEPAQAPRAWPRALAVQAGADGRPSALRREADTGERDGWAPGQAGWEPIRVICAHWRLRARWWARTTHRYYYLVETLDGALLEIYQEQEDGRWWLAGRRD